MRDEQHEQTPWWRTRSSIVALGVLAIAAFFLFAEHRAHVFGALPYLLLLACSLMRLFMHRGRRMTAAGAEMREKNSVRRAYFGLK